MALTEAQVLRYSRQVLLGEVGGRGQERLLAQAFHLVGGGAALETAAAYLAGAGCRVSAEAARPVRPEERGFLLPQAAAGSPFGPALAEGVALLNPDAARRPGLAADLAAGPAPGEVGQVPADFRSGGPRVAVGALPEGAAGVAWAAAGACADCFARACAPLQAGLEGPLSVAAGSLAALVAERLVLGLTAGVGRLELPAGGGSHTVETGPCPHRP